MEIKKAKVEKLLITRPFNEPCVEVNKLSIYLDGIKGDRHFGKTSISNVRTNKLLPNWIEVANFRTITIVSVEELSEISNSLGFEILPEDLDANITLSGISELTKIAPGTFLRFPGKTILFVTAENIPCSNPSKKMVARGAPKEKAFMFAKEGMGKRGLTAMVFASGYIKIEDEVEILKPQVFE